MTVEEFVIHILSSALDVPVAGNVPSSGTDYVTVEQLGSRSTDQVYTASLAVQSWGESRESASEINEQVKNAMAEAAALDTVSRCALTDDYYYPDIETKHPRYQAVFDVVLF